MRAFVDSMLQDVRSSYRVREEQLATAARAYKKRLQKITKTHNALLVAYRYYCLLVFLLHGYYKHNYIIMYIQLIKLTGIIEVIRWYINNSCYKDESVCT